MGLALLAAVALASGDPAEPATAPAPSQDGDAAGKVEDAAPGEAGLRVYLDPETGDLVRPPVDAGEEGLERSPALDPTERLNTYGGDLHQERLEAGGYMVDLRGRFRSSVVATIDPETDTVSIDCVAEPARGAGDDESEAPDGQ